MNKKIYLSGLLLVFLSVLALGQLLPCTDIKKSSVTLQDEINNLLFSTDMKSILYSDLVYTKPVFSVIDDDIIDEFTWSVLRYDHPVSSENFGRISVPIPTSGLILIPTDMMSYETCYAAASIYQDDKMDVLTGLETYDIQNMIHTQFAFFGDKDEWNSPDILSYRKENADEMKILGRLCLKGDLVGDCYATASFNTAVLRLCGFSPEEVFTAGITGHAVTVVKVNDQWYVLDGTYAYIVRRGMAEGLLFTHYPNFNHLFFLENDRYFINFCHYSQLYPYLKNPYCNMEPGLLSDILNQLLPLFDYPQLGIRNWQINEFCNQSIPCPDMTDIAFPYDVENASGDTMEEKAASLQSLNTAFIFTQADKEQIDQFDKSLYGLGFLSVDYPQAYANAAKYAAWTSYIACRLDVPNPWLDYHLASLWIRGNILTAQTMPSGCIAFSDLPYLCRMGSTIDQAVMAYGTLRNMKKQNDFWQPDDLYILITENNNGYVAVNTTNDWRYLSFQGGKQIYTSPPEGIGIIFNEDETLGAWNP